MAFKDEDFEGKLAKRECADFAVGTYWRSQAGADSYYKVLKVNSKRKSMELLDSDGGESYSYWTNGVFQSEEYDDEFPYHLKYPFVQVDEKGKLLKTDKKPKTYKVAEKNINDIWVL